MKQPICRKCKKPLLIKIVPRDEFYAPESLCFIARCPVCNEQMGIIYTVNERMGIEREREANITNPKMLVIH